VRSQFVTYSLSFLPPLESGGTFNLGRTIPIEFQLFDWNHTQITSLSAVVGIQIQQVDAGGEWLGDPFTPASSNNKGLFVGDSGYQFNWNTKGLSAGYYEILIEFDGGLGVPLDVQLV